MKLSSRISSVQPSATLAITSKAKKMMVEGEDVIILAAGEPDFDTPENIKKAGIEAIEQGRTRYTPSSGTLSLKEAVQRKFKQDNDLSYDTGQIIISCGAKHCLYNVLQVLCEPGDEVLMIPPYWVSYPEMVKLAGGSPVFMPVRRDNDLKITGQDIRDIATERTKAIILNTPSNPAGVVYSRKELEDIASACLENGIIVISDEIYEKIVFDGEEHVSIASVSEEMKRSTVVVNGVSKSYSMTGWRIGYMAGDRNIMKMVGTLQSHSTSNPCSISQSAAEEALTGTQTKLAENRRTFQQRRDLLMELLAEEDRLAPLKPSGAFYLFCGISGTGMDSSTFARLLLEEAGVALIPGAPFGDQKAVRMSFATDKKTLRKGVERIIKWLR